MQASKKPIQYFRQFFSAPFIYILIFPLVVLDFFVELYHRVCFPLYKIPYVKRGQYIRIDRHKLKYLNWIEKINCAYCGYANGLAHYLSEIGARTEKYWCGLKHAKDPNFKSPKYHEDFLEYGDEKGLKEFLEK